MAPRQVQNQRTVLPLAATPVRERAGSGNAPDEHGDEDEGVECMRGFSQYRRLLNICKDHNRDGMEDERMEAGNGRRETERCGAG